MRAQFPESRGVWQWAGTARWSRRAAQTRALGVVLGFALGGCGAEAPIGGDAPGTQPGESQRNAPDVSGVDAPDWVRTANEAPGYADQPYPAGPYGSALGDTIANLEFSGWSAPAAARYDVEASHLVRFADYYDPDGTKNIELLVINAVAVWCGVCQQEYADIQSAQLYAELRPRGVELFGILFEDADSAPAKYSDLNLWASYFGVEFPFVLDPGLKTGVYFDRSATPMNMIVDAKTMQILLVTTGYSQTLYDTVEQLLKQRGR